MILNRTGLGWAGPLPAMEAAAVPSLSLISLTTPNTRTRRGNKVTVICSTTTKPTVLFPPRKCCSFSVNDARRRRRTTTRVLPINDVTTTVLDPAPVEITWQIVVGAIAGVTPFVVAGIEFSKRIIEQRRCEVCGGSGVVFREKKYFRCPECGGFLPWQSWKRFFSG